MATYRGAGVDLEAGDRVVEMIKPVAAATYRSEVLAGVGPFSGLFALDTARYAEPVLVSTTDSVGTKVLLAGAHGRHRSLGVDIVHHCVNDVVTSGAEPLFFLDYIGIGLLVPSVVGEIVAGAAEACRAVGCALLGGETAELSDLYAPGTYDLAGFMVGVCDRRQLIDTTEIREGDLLLALPSNGLHTNGYSLARRVIPSRSLSEPIGNGRTVLDALLEPHACYLDPVQRLRAQVRVKGLAHITGGGLPGNIPRILPAGLGARIHRGRWPEPVIFSYLQPFIPDGEMWRAFNMGIGMVAVIDADQAATAARALGGDASIVGEVVAGQQPRVQIVE